MDYVVLIDSNAIIGNGYRIRNKILDDFFKRNKLILSEPTFEEVIRKYNKNQVDKEKELETAITNASKFGIDIELKEIKKNNFEENFHNELCNLNTQILPNSDASIEFIFRKSFWLEKPFKSKNDKEAGGFRDALIWNLWLNFLEKNHSKYNEIILVNQDSDFVTKEKLHHDLIDDLQTCGIPIEKVSVLSNIKGLHEMAIDYLQYDKTETYITEKSLEELQSKVIQLCFDKKGLEGSIQEKLMGIIPEENEPSIDIIIPKGDIKVDTMSGPKEDIYLYFTERFTIVNSYFMPKNDYLIDMPKNVTILDRDWNELVMHVSEEFEIEIGFETELNMFHDLIKDFNFYLEGELIPLITGSHHEDDYLTNN